MSQTALGYRVTLAGSQLISLQTLRLEHGRTYRCTMQSRAETSAFPSALGSEASLAVKNSQVDI